MFFKCFPLLYTMFSIISDYLLPGIVHVFSESLRLTCFFNAFPCACLNLTFQWNFLSFLLTSRLASSMLCHLRTDIRLSCYRALLIFTLFHWIAYMQLIIKLCEWKIIQYDAWTAFKAIEHLFLIHDVN